MKLLTDEQAAVLLAFIESFDLYTTGAWSAIEQAMQDDWGIYDPETASNEAREALQ